MPSIKRPDPAATAAPATPAEQPRPRLGSMVMVKPAPGAKLMNLETGAWFVEGEATPQTVTVTTLARLADGDLLFA